ncbi:sulfur carrier protein ThiS [Marinobacter sp. SS21]|uniref:sulfur carrier protein ThiS n=1 Tax=Marinobacter sp. SS21 TaxID=2979460 RepID=UPI00232C1290|nr:sulfur carrier protein ThiS [Marinobacter sp. SS21]MDC0662325.1 sulfur carrier protein ThiS [Marinobacter sp. SS21]
MNIHVNGDAMELAEPATIATLLERLALQGKRLAVEVNEEIVPRSQHGDYRLSAGDRVEVVHAIGGG